MVSEVSSENSSKSPPKGPMGPKNQKKNWPSIFKLQSHPEYVGPVNVFLGYRSTLTGENVNQDFNCNVA